MSISHMSVCVSAVTYCVGRGCLLQLSHQFDGQVGHLAVICVHDLLRDRVDEHATLRRVRHHKVPNLAFEVRLHRVEVRLEDDAKLCLKDLVLSLVSRDLHHVHELRRGILLDLQDQEAD